MKNIITHKTKLFHYFYSLIILFNFLTYYAQTPTWSVISNPGPIESGGLMLLLSDGSVICKTEGGGSDGIGNVWNKLTPDVNGSYANGTWSTIAPMKDTRLYFSSQMMKDGRVYVAGGEYGTGSSKGEIYDPITNTWTSFSNTNNFLGDANSAILDNGKILQASLQTLWWDETLLFDPSTNSYSIAPNTLGQHAESTWIKLPDNSILFINTGTTNSERYIPSLNQWIADANLPVNLYDQFLFETGPSILLPNGKVFCLGSLGNSAIYTPSGNNLPGTWIAGPSIPNNHGCPDTQAAITVDGKIIFSAGPKPISSNSVFIVPTYFYEYDYITNSYTQLTAPNNTNLLQDTAFNVNMLNLPDGSIMLSDVSSNNYYFHKPNGQPLAVGKPTITTVSQNTCTNTFKLTGLLFNGISEGASFGDDWQMNTNFPIVRLSSGTNVYYARTHHWNHTGVQQWTQQDTTLFDLPANIPNGTYSLYVVANGISSDPITFTFTPTPSLISSLIAPNVCSGNTFTYNAVANLTNTSVMWTRAAISGISNTAILTPQSNNPNEVLINNSNVPLTVVYSYTLMNGSCVNYNQVSVVVGVNPLITISGNTLICSNQGTIIAAYGASNWLWNNGSTSNALVINPTIATTTITTVYTVTANSFGCNANKQFTLTVKPSPTVSISGNLLVCYGEAATLTASSSNGNSYYWDNGSTTNTTSVVPLSTGAYSIVVYNPNGCKVKSSITVTVDACTNINKLNNNINSFAIYPNPLVDNQLTIELSSNEAGPSICKLYNILGELVYQEKLNFERGIHKKEINLIDIPKGIYTLILQNEISELKAKIIKE